LRYLILSDIHANLEALAAVLARARGRSYQRVVVLGDFVGYGADPNAVIDRVRKLRRPKVLVRGNHDRVAAGLDPGRMFNPVALFAARWTAQTLSDANRAFLGDLPVGPVEVDGKFVICHGSPLDEDAYVFSAFDAFEIFSTYSARIVFFGHTHVPSMFVEQGSGIRVALLRGESVSLNLAPGLRYLFNPGSIGQPRDRDPRAAYMTYDSARRIVRWHRVLYPVERAQQRILKAGLPKVLADRLALGV